MAWTNRMFRWRDIATLMVGFSLVQVLSYVFINRLMFHPVKDGYSETFPAFVDIGTNGCRMAAIVSGPKRGKAAIIYCHGNAEDATSVLDRFAGMASGGYTIASVDYPGYGLSDGNPNEIGCYRVAHRLYDWLVHERGFATNEIFVVGYSIGTGVAVELAASRPVAGMWLEAPYLSAPRIVTRMRLLVVDSFPSYLRIENVKCPILIMHGTDDRIVPFSQGKALFELANEPKFFVPISLAGHDNFIEVYGEDNYENLLRDFLAMATSNAIWTKTQQ